MQSEELLLQRLKAAAGRVEAHLAPKNVGAPVAPLFEALGVLREDILAHVSRTDAARSTSALAQGLQEIAELKSRLINAAHHAAT